MQQKRNYQKELDAVLQNIKKQEILPKLLLHSCCAPCSSYVLEYLSEYFEIIVFYYNPNISPEEEYHKRVTEIKRLLAQMPLSHPVRFMEGTYDPQRFYRMAKGLEEIPEGGERCYRCYKMRLGEAYQAAQETGADYFTTTLSISPLKNATWLNTIGEEFAGPDGGGNGTAVGPRWLVSDFKKRDGYKRSIQLSAEYDLYRQNYCGCIFSVNEMKERERRKQETISNVSADTSI